MRRAKQVRTARSALALTGVVGAMTWGVMAPVASAHDALVGSSPAAGASVAAPSTVKLTFSAAVLSKPAPPQVVVTDAAGHHYESACATTLDADVTAPVSLGKAGTYRVQWRVVSSDGHPVSGEYRFISTSDGAGSGRDSALNCSAGEAGSSSGGASTSTSAPAASAPVGSASSATAATPSVDEPSSGANVPLYVAGAAVAIAVAAGAVMLVRSLRH